VRDDYDDEFEDDDQGAGVLLMTMVATIGLWAVVIVVTWALR
jgi:hypothetical protein